MDPETVHQDSVIVDAHCDTLGRVLEGQRRLGEHSSMGQFDLPRALEGGLTLELMATFTSALRPGTGARQTLQFIDVFYQELEAYADLALQAISVDDVRRAKESGKVALMLSMEGAEGLEGDLRLLRTFYRLGLRCLGITWNRRNEAADGTYELGTGGGLTQFGQDLVKECNRLGIVLDLAHLAPRGVKDVLALVDGPVIVTHANCHALWPHPRNLTDAQLEAIARTGGVVGFSPVPLFLGENEKQSDFSTLLDHVDHMVSVMGENGVGLGMDFDGMEDSRVTGIEDISMLPNLTKGLSERGYSPAVISKILGGNFMRVLDAVL
jgi:membrane dipeptidase